MVSKRAYVSTVFLLLLGWMLFLYVRNNYADFLAIRFEKPWLLIPFTLIYLAYFVAGGLIINDSLKPFKVVLTNIEWFGLSIITGFYSLIMPFRGGMFVRALYLKRKHNFSYSLFASNTAGIYVINLALLGIFGIVGVLHIAHTYGFMPWLFFLLFTGVLLGSFFVLFFSPVFDSKKWPLTYVSSILGGWRSLRKDRMAVLKIVVHTSVQILAGVFLTILSFAIFNVHVSFFEAFFLIAVGSLGTLFAITPSNLGIQELLLAVSSNVLGISPALAILSALVGRLISTIILLLLGPIFSYILLGGVFSRPVKK